MPPLTAAQHFFSSVPADRSPTKRRGYQTLFRTRGLSADVIRAIEDRTQYVTAPGDPVKHQFYALPGSLFAISQSVALAELDEFGRKGRYLSHTLVFDRAAFQALAYCPLDVLTQFEFATTLPQVFAQGQGATGEVPAIRLDVTPLWMPRAAQQAQLWPPDQLAALGRLAWQARAVSDKREAVALIGSADEALDALAIMFLLCAPADRVWLSFDTQSAGCDWGRSIMFWGQGYADRANAKTPHVIDLNARRISTTLTPANDGPYAVWVIKDGLTARTQLAALEQQRGWARQLEATLLEGVPARGLPRDFIARFAQMNASAVAASWLALLPTGLSPEFVQPLARGVMSEAGDYLNVLADGAQAEQLPEFLFNALLQLRAIPAKPDRAVLEKWIKTTLHTGLRTLPPFWNKDEGAWRDRLKALPAEDYEWLMKNLVHWPQIPIALWEALVEPHVQAWVRLVARVVPPSEWKKPLSRLEKMGEPAVELLSEAIPFLSEPARNEIAKWLKGYKGPARNLRNALGMGDNQKGSKR